MNVFAARTVEELNAMYSLGMIPGQAHRAAVGYVEAREQDFDATLSSADGAQLALELSRGAVRVISLTDLEGEHGDSTL